MKGLLPLALIIHAGRWLPRSVPRIAATAEILASGYDCGPAGGPGGVCVIFVGKQDRLSCSAGQAAPVWLRRAFQIWSSGLLACWQRRVVMALAPATVQCMPESLSRWPMTALQPASASPEPVSRPRERNQW